MDAQHSDVLIIGGGIAGLTAAIYAARANLSVRILEKEICGGLVNWTHTLENVPSYKSIHGMDYMAACREQVEDLGVDIQEISEVVSLELDGSRKEVLCAEGERYTADALILAMGRKPVPLPLDTEFERVHYCSICDGSAYKDKDILVIGGGNSAFDESLYMHSLGVRSIHMVEMMPQCLAAASTQDKARQQGLRVSVSTRLTELVPLPSGKALARLHNDQTGEETEEEVDGVFCFIGQMPNTAVLQGKLAMDRGYIVTDEFMRTDVAGVFAAGDVRSKTYRQITTAMADGTIAALEAEKYLRSAGA